MNPPAELELWFRVALIGAGATLMLNLWSVLAKRLFRTPAPNWGFVGRWLGHIPEGQFVQKNISTASPIPGERLIGWIAHYATGIFYAALVVVLFGSGWVRDPTPFPAFSVGCVGLYVCSLLSARI